MHADFRNEAPGRAAPDATVAVVSICGPERLEACLAALDRQRDPPSFEIVVAYDGERGGWERLRALREDVVWVGAAPSPPLLAAAALRAARGAVVLLTEDHCVPAPDWIRRLHAAAAGGAVVGAGAVGGPVALTRLGRSSLEWAFHFSDFAPYVPPVEGGPSRSLSVCNVAYPRATLERLGPARVDAFDETRVHATIRRDVGPLVMVPDALVVTGRRIRLADALRERYTLGRLYGAVRFSDVPVVRRSLRALATPGLPPLLLGRLARRSWRTPGAALRFSRGLPHLAVLVCAWSCGEAVGLLTGRGPLDVRIAPELADQGARP
ncbi:MAG: hypothetical protein ACREMK_00160 [Gemmatimonadota bacterium]